MNSERSRLTSPSALGAVSVGTLAIIDDLAQGHLIVSVCNSLMIQDVKHLPIRIFSLVRCLSSSFAHFLIGWFSVEF